MWANVCRLARKGIQVIEQTFRFGNLDHVDGVITMASSNQYYEIFLHQPLAPAGGIRLNTEPGLKHLCRKHQ